MPQIIAPPLAISPTEWFLLFLAISGGLASIVGIPLAYLLARRGRQRPHLQYAVDFDVLVDPGGFASGGALTFRGQPVTAVSRTYIAIWNRRGDTVRGPDIVLDDPLRIQLANGDAPLQARLLYTSREACAMSVAQADTSVAIGFDFLDEGDGGVVEVIHQSTEQPTVSGTIRGTAIDAGSTTITLTPTRSTGCGTLADESDSSAASALA